MVPFSTPTALDKLEEVRALNLEIAKLVSLKEIADRETRETAAAVEETRNRKEKLEGDIASIEKTIGSTIEDIRGFFGTYRKNLEDTAAMMRETSEKTHQLTARIEQLSKEVRGLEKERENLLASLAKENETMSEKRLDLDIYHRRIVEAAEKYLPGQKITTYEPPCPT